MSLYPVVILAGGLATRLRPITEKIPKALVEVGGHPFIYHQLRLLHSHDIKQVIISAGYRGDMIRDYVGDGSRFGMQVDYAFDGASPLGTGGAIRKALPFLTSPFFALYGDSYLPCDYAAIQTYFAKKSQPALMTVYRNLGKWDTSNVEMANDSIIQYNKKNKSPRMEYIDYGLGVFTPSVFEDLQEGKSADLAEVYQQLVLEKKLLAYAVPERFYEIGSFEGLHELDDLLTKNPNQFIKKE
jgi:NDP-sugar pyrophosphorylase family protein